MRFLPALLLLTWLIGMPVGAAAPPPLVVIGVSGVSWEDVTATNTPHLQAFADRAATGELSVRTVYPTTCASDGWMTLGAGVRAADHRGCRQLEPGEVGEAVAGAGASYRPELGKLGVELETLGMSALAVGPQAALALTDENGTIRGETGSFADLAALAPGHDVILVDLGGMPEVEGAKRSAGDPFSSWFSSPPPSADEGKMADLDRRFGEVMEELPDARVILASVGDSRDAALRVVMDSGSAGVLTSASTHRVGLVQTIDLAPTILEHVGGSWDGPGRIMTSVEGSRPDIQGATSWTRAAQGPFFIAWILTFLASLALSGRRLMLAVSAVPAAAVLAQIVPWYRLPGQVPLFLVLVGLIATSIAFIAHALVSRAAEKVAIVVGFNLGVVALLAAAASPLYLNSPLGSLPQVGGRFYGMTNMAFAACSASAVLLAAALARILPRRRAAAWTLVIGAGLIVIDGVPSLGADVGGPPVLAPAFVLLAWLISGRRIGPAACGIAAASAILVPVAFAALDYLRPIDKRTHLGSFVAEVVGGQGGATLVRKASQVLAQWPLLLAGAVLIGLAALWWYRSGLGFSCLDPAGYAVEVWAALALAFITLGGALINDSGMVIPLVAGGQIPAWVMLRRFRPRGPDRRGTAVPDPD